MIYNLPHFLLLSLTRLQYQGIFYGILATMSSSQNSPFANWLEVGVDPSETQPLLISAPQARAGTSRFYPTSHDNDSNTPYYTNAVRTTLQNEKCVNTFHSKDGKSRINSIWNHLRIRSTSPSNEHGPRKIILIVAITTMLLSLATIWFLTAGNGFLCQAFSLKTCKVAQFAPPEIQNLWGSYTPYFSVEPYTPPPSNCRISQVRRGIYPTSFMALNYLVDLRSTSSVVFWLLLLLHLTICNRFNDMVLVFQLLGRPQGYWLQSTS